MRIAPNKNHFIAFGALVVMAAWVPITLAATPDERAKCEEMAKEMGLEKRHAHKTPGSGPMNLTHERCKQILAEPVEKKGNTTQDR